MPIQLAYSGSQSEFKKGVTKANTILKSKEFFRLVSSKRNPFFESLPKDLRPSKVAELLEDSKLVLTLKEYERPYTIGGMFWAKYPRRIYGNVNAIPYRTSCEFAAVFMHEAIHALSYNIKKYNFSHCMKRNEYPYHTPGDHKNTAPYWVQAKVRREYCTDKKSMRLMIVELQ